MRPEEGPASALDSVSRWHPPGPRFRGNNGNSLAQAGNAENDDCLPDDLLAPAARCPLAGHLHPSVARTLLCGHNSEFGRVANPPQAASLPHTDRGSNAIVGCGSAALCHSAILEGLRLTAVFRIMGVCRR
jgi:hypothetical protein